MALGMTMNGAAGATLDSMRATLGYADMSLADIDASYESLIDLLRGLDSHVDLRIANSIWYRQGFPFEQSFLDTGKEFFDAKITGANFDDPGTPALINDWVSQATNGRIPTIVDLIPRDMVMYLINAIYFKGTWTTQFDKGATKPMPFFAADGSTKQVPMMYVHGTFPARSTATYQAAEFPYGGGAYSMIVVVPREGQSVDSLIASFGPSQWESLIASLSDQEGDVYLPRFQLQWKKSLNDALTALGMGIAFGSGADFTGMSKAGGLAISDVDQSTFVKVDEEGTEAAAVTSVGVIIVSLPPALLVANRPFFFAIRERLSGTLLFVGKMAVPPV
jgi:serpin B